MSSPKLGVTYFGPPPPQESSFVSSDVLNHAPPDALYICYSTSACHTKVAKGK